MISAVMFVLGFSTVFVALGASAGLIGGLIRAWRVDGLHRYRLSYRQRVRHQPLDIRDVPTSFRLGARNKEIVHNETVPTGMTPAAVKLCRAELFCVIFRSPVKNRPKA
jgi:hypothetical protein